MPLVGEGGGWPTLTLTLVPTHHQVRALEWGGVRLERLEGVEGSGLEWEGLVASGDVHTQAAEQARWLG